jgi:hypothetical protein
MSVYFKGRFYHYDFIVDGERYSGSTKLEDEIEARLFEDDLRSKVATAQNPRSRPSQKTGFVYFIQGTATQLIKIGYTVDVDARLAHLAIGSPDRLILLGFCPGTRSDESFAHNQLSDCRSHGEWFRPEPRVLEFMAKVLAA